MSKLVRDLMRKGVITCQPEASLGQVAVMLTQHHVHSLVIVDRGGRPIGIITDFDLLAGEWLSAEPEGLAVMRQMTAGELMSSPVNTIEANATLEEAGKIMQTGEIHRLLVTDQSKMVGILSISDFIAYLSEKVPLKRDSVADVMSDAFLACRDKTPITAVARAMTDTGWRSIIVVNATGKPLGVVSGFDLLPYCIQDGSTEVIVSDVMHPALTIHITASLREAADKMIKHHHHRLIVIDENQPETVPLGIISSFDIVAQMARPDSVWQV